MLPPRKPSQIKRHTSPGSSESPKQVGPEEAYTETHIITMTRLRDKERILKATREKQVVTSKGAPVRLSI